MAKSIDIEDSIKDEVVLDDDQLVCALTGDTKKVTPKESILQSVIFVTRNRVERTRHLDDDLPLISQSFYQFKKKGL